MGKQQPKPPISGMSDLDEVDLAVVRVAILHQLLELEKNIGLTTESNEELNRLRRLYSFFMRCNH